MPMPRLLTPSACTPSAPILLTQSPRPARISARSLGRCAEFSLTWPGSEARVGEGKPGQRNRVVRGRATVDPRPEVVRGNPGEGRYGVSDRLLQRKIEDEVAATNPPALDAVGEHSRVLARAIMCERRVRRGRREFGPRVVEPRHVRSALQILGVV